MNNPPDKQNARVFFALWPTAGGSNALAEWQVPLKQLCGGRAMRGDTLHVTLVFVGNVSVARLEALQLAAQEVVAEGFELVFDEARYWGHNHIVYAAPRHVPHQLHHLVGKLEQRLSAHRFKFDQQEYKPHATILRNARWTDALLPVMQPLRWKISDFALVRSAQQDGLTGYSVLARFPLNPSGG